MKSLRTVLFLFVACALVRAERPTAQSVGKLLEIMHVEDSLGPLQAQLKSMMNGVAANPQTTSDMSPEQKAQVARQVDSVASQMAEAISWKNMKQVYVETYQDSFTQEEVDAMVAFYETPVGRSIAGKLPGVTQAATEKVQAKLMPIMEKIVTDAQSAAAAQ